MIVDSHCHLDYEPMKSSLDEVLGRAASEGIDFMLTISVEDKKYDQILKIVNIFVSFFFFATRSSYYSVARDLGRLAPPARGALQGGERGQGAAVPQPCGPPEAFLRDFGVALHPRLPLGC